MNYKNILIKSFSVFLMIALLVSCGYKDKNECMVKEQQKGDGATRGDVVRYCNDLFKKKETKFFSNETKLKEKKDYLIKAEDGRVKVTNYSDHQINIVKIVGSECGATNISIKWEDQINYIAGSLIRRGLTKDVIGIGEYNCYYHWVGYK